MKKNILSFIILLVGFITCISAQELDFRIKEAFSQKEIDAMSSEQIKSLNCFFQYGYYTVRKSEVPKNAKIVPIKTITEKRNPTKTIEPNLMEKIKIFNPLLYNFEKYIDPLNVIEEKQVYFLLNSNDEQYNCLVFRVKTEIDKACNALYSIYESNN